MQMLRTHTDHDTCCTPTSTEVYATLNPCALSHHSILSELLHMDSILHPRQKISSGKTEELPFPISLRGCEKMLGFFISHTPTPIICPISGLSPVVHTSGATLWAVKIPVGTDAILAELLPEVVCTWQWAHFHMGWVINTPPKISGVLRRYSASNRVGLFALWEALP